MTNPLITITAIDGETIGIAVSDINCVTELKSDIYYSQVMWKNHSSCECVWTTVRGSVKEVVSLINEQLR